MPDSPARSPTSLALPYAAPYLLYVALGSLVDLRTHAEWIYGARVLAGGGALAFFWRDYLPLRGPRSTGGSLAAGAAGGPFGARPLGAPPPRLAAAHAPAGAGPPLAGPALRGALLAPPPPEPLFFRRALR